MLTISPRRFIIMSAISQFPVVQA